MKRVVVLIFLVAAALVAAAGCRPRYATNPPEESPDDPILATVGDEAVTVSFFRIALSGLPLTLRTRYMTDQGKREFLEDLIDGMAYYLEGKRRNLDKSLEFQAEMEDRQKETLVQMERTRSSTRSGPHRKTNCGSFTAATAKKRKARAARRRNSTPSARSWKTASTRSAISKPTRTGSTNSKRNTGSR
ncbi:MAG: hypothetical protein M5R36_18500 [Deltaproteobacteria bacterium]|nr:hypothetical protein [Deltaproteobacteria bacterium]